MLSKELIDLEKQVAYWRTLFRQGEERLRLAMEMACLGVWEWSIPDNRITRDGYHEELFGLPQGSFSGTYEEFLACVHPDDREPVKLAIARCLASCQEYRQEYRVLWPDGSIRWIEGRARVHCDERGEPVRMLGVMQDVTDRKRIEEQQSRFRALFEAAQDAVLIADDSRHYVEGNPAAGELFGLPISEIVGRRVDEFIAEIPGTDVRNAWQQFETTGAQRGECRIRRADGSLCDVEYSAKMNFLPGLHLSILRDVTERRRIAEALEKQASELARSNADLQQFAYVTSHDLQEPLRAIINFSQMLVKRYRGQLDAEADQFLEFIVSGAFRMKGLIDSLLTYSRLVNVEAMPFAPVPLDAAVHWATMNLQTVIEETRASVTHGELPIVMAAHVQLVQLFQNLISNAIKYRMPGKPAQIQVFAERLEEDWVISVADNGMGIHPKHAQRIFGVFKRLHGDNIPGTGIGLAICKRIVGKHGGRIWVDSAPGQGATFRFTLPAK
jgi:PAS domain S-box-containing protein